MKKKFINTVYVEGYVYEHDLKLKQVSNPDSKNYGKDFINGNVTIATDEGLTNTVQVHFIYVSPDTAGKTFLVLNSIIDGKIPTVLGEGKDKAGKLTITTNIAVNDWYRDDGTLVSTKRNEGGFLDQVKGDFTVSEDKRATFKVDMLITNVATLDADEEKGYEEKVTLEGYVFNYRKELLPVNFRVKDPAAIKFFTKLDISKKNPLFTQVWGDMLSQTVTRKTITESAFGADLVEESESSFREYVVVNKSKDDYLYDDESTITVEELKAGLADREQSLAEKKKRSEEYKASRQTKPAAASFDTTNSDEEKYDF